MENLTEHLQPEARIARQVLKRLNISPPIDVEAIAQKYASVEYIALPFDIDGVSLYLKIPKKRPRILVNSTPPLRRRRFTLAHELGHILIPWHMGTIVDDAQYVIAGTAIEYRRDIALYRQMEGEANAFAAELLMPSEWVHSIVSSEVDLVSMHDAVMSQANVSPIAALFAMIKHLPAGYVFCVVDEANTVVYSGRSQGTLANALTPREHVDLETAYSYAANKFDTIIGDNTYVWWQLPETIHLPDVDDPREWRVILDEICEVLNFPRPDRPTLKMSINGSIAYANGVVKRSDNYCPEAIYSSCIQRLSSHKIYGGIVAHPDFEKVLKKRAQEMYLRNKCGRQSESVVKAAV